MELQYFELDCDVPVQIATLLFAMSGDDGRNMYVRRYI